MSQDAMNEQLQADFAKFNSNQKRFKISLLGEKIKIELQYKDDNKIYRRFVSSRVSEIVLSALIPLGFALDAVFAYNDKYLACGLALAYSATCISYGIVINYYPAIAINPTDIDFVNNIMLWPVAYHANFSVSTLIFAVLNFVEDSVQYLLYHNSVLTFFAFTEAFVLDQLPELGYVLNTRNKIVVILKDKEEAGTMEWILVYVFFIPSAVYYTCASMVLYMISCLCINNNRIRTTYVQGKSLLMGKTLVSLGLFLYVSIMFSMKDTTTICENCLDSCCEVGDGQICSFQFIQNDCAGMNFNCSNAFDNSTCGSSLATWDPDGMAMFVAFMVWVFITLCYSVLVYYRFEQSRFSQIPSYPEKLREIKDQVTQT